MPPFLRHCFAILIALAVVTGPGFVRMAPAAAVHHACSMMAEAPSDGTASRKHHRPDTGGCVDCALCAGFANTARDPLLDMTAAFHAADIAYLDLSVSLSGLTRAPDLGPPRTGA